jgi:hypothetical protein
MLRDEADMRALQPLGPERRVDRRRWARVMLASVGTLLTVAAAYVGVKLALYLWNEYREQPGCAAPEVAVAPQAAVSPPPAPAFDPPQKKDVRIGVLSVRDDAVAIAVGEERHELAGYPPPSSPKHKRGTLTTAVVAPQGDEQQVAIAGVCYGDSGSEFRLPSCAREFVRIYRVEDGAHLRDLRVPWQTVDDERRLLAMAFDPTGDRLAVLVRASWADCSWEGAGIELIVYWLADGTQLLRRVLEINDEGGARRLTVSADEVRVATTRPNVKEKVRVIALPPPFGMTDCD